MAGGGCYLSSGHKGANYPGAVSAWGGGATYLPDTKEQTIQGQFNLFDLTENKKEKNFIFYLAKLLFGCCFGFKTDHRTIRKKININNENKSDDYK